MGGHTQTGTFDSMIDAVVMWEACAKEYTEVYWLTLEKGVIQLQDGKYILAMRFVN